MAILREEHRTEVAHPTPSVLAEWREVERDDLRRSYPDALAQIHSGGLDGLVIHDVLDAAELERIMERLPELDAQMRSNEGGRLFGHPLPGTEDLGAYLATAAASAAAIDGLLGSSFSGRVASVLGDVSGGRPAMVPTELSEPHRAYLPLTVRLFDPHHGALRAHTGNEIQNDYAGYDELRRTARTYDALSFFIVVQAPAAGGELVIYDVDWESSSEWLNMGRLKPIRTALMQDFDKGYIPPRAGDMVLFNGGRIWHRVADVEGERPRVTIGGFTTFDNALERVLFWS